MPHLIIARVRLAHCKKGPQVCEKCREMVVEKICLLDVDPPDQGMVQRRVMSVEIAGQAVWREYDIVRSFAGEREAREYAAAQGITDVIL
jgi:hypothetical protein